MAKIRVRAITESQSPGVCCAMYRREPRKPSISSTCGAHPRVVAANPSVFVPTAPASAVVAVPTPMTRSSSARWLQEFPYRIGNRDLRESAREYRFLVQTKQLFNYWTVLKRKKQQFGKFSACVQCRKGDNCLIFEIQHPACPDDPTFLRLPASGRASERGAS